MKLFTCPNCGSRLYFENSKCLSCGSDVLYEPERAEFVLAGTPEGVACSNLEACDCNWTARSGQLFCHACALNQTVPDMSVEGNRERWARVERAKRRAVYTLLAFGLRVEPKATPDDETGLAFDLLADPIGAGPGGEHILTGHDNGLITLNVAEADSVEREKMRVEMGENYRTLLGHFRHELGHYYWDRLVRDDQTWLDAFRQTFRDERLDYAQALKDHYAKTPSLDWQETHISAYAASHPWEDWAESWAHYLHITDTLEMVQALDMPLGALNTAVNKLRDRDEGGGPVSGKGEETDDGFTTILERWQVLSEASNSINRCMGLSDLYPFVIAPATAAKLKFIHDLLTHHEDVMLRDHPVIGDSVVTADSQPATQVA